MKHFLFALTAIIAGFLIIFEIAFTQSLLRFVGIIGLLLVVFGTASLPFISSFWIAEKFKLGNKLFSILFISMLATVIISDFLIYNNWIDEQEKKLNEQGKLLKSKVVNVEWESRGKSSPAANYVYYSFEVDGEIYEHSTENDTLKVGNEIVIKYLPDNPENHKIVNSSIPIVN